MIGAPVRQPVDQPGVAVEVEDDRPTPLAPFTTSDGAPKKRPCISLVQEHLETFLAQVEAQTGASLPDFVTDEFDAFLQCEILARPVIP